jgi:DNA-directed RNA polymerase sigma subunit (sigma70/sigma32)
MKTPKVRGAKTLKQRLEDYRAKRDAEIRKRLKAGESRTVIGYDYGISAERVRQIASGR